MSGTIETVTGPIQAEQLGVTLMHEHIFVRNLELEANFPAPEWDEEVFIQRAREGLQALMARGIRSMVDLTVIGLGRDIHPIIRIAEGLDFNIIAATGYYTFKDLPSFFHNHGPGRMIEGPDPLHQMFVRDIREGISGTRVKAGIIKVATDKPGFTPDVTRVFEAAVRAHKDTGVPITTHSDAAEKGGLEQQDFFRRNGVDLTRTVIGHCGDSDDFDYLQRLMDAGSFIGMDRFGLTWFATDEARTRTVAKLCRRGYADRMTLSHDAGYYSVNSEPSYRDKALPAWKHTLISDVIIPRLREQGVTEAQLHQMMVVNPTRILAAR
ncbi:phosphotriesterase family protein [Roseomonas elaeocarpi]|uniref:Phosphotriesterase n=1 Tax=Roseomonas elaeocarpi TaxID=907779 RepID=A0ABV6JM94_9PROT